MHSLPPTSRLVSADPVNRGLMTLWCASVALYLVLYGLTLEPNQTKAAQNYEHLVAVPAAELGRRTPYPDWVHGHWIRVDRSHATTDSVLRVVDAYLARNIPVRVVVIDHGWAKRGTWTLDKQRFPDIKTPDGKSYTVIEALRRMGIRVVLDANPLLQEDTDDFDMAAKRGWLLKPVKDATGGEAPGLVSWDDESGVQPIRGALLDVTDAAANAWLTQRIQAMLAATQADGIKNDAYDALFHALGRDANGAIGRNGFVPVRNWSKAYYWTFFDAARVNGTMFDRVTIFRPVDSLFQTHFETFGTTDISFATWVGNHPPTFAGLRASLMNMIHSSYRGFLNFGASVGGAVGKDVARLSEASPSLPDAVLKSIKRRELLLRWAAVGALTPFFENGGHEGAHAPWRVGCADESTEKEQQRQRNAAAARGNSAPAEEGATYFVKCSARASTTLVERGYRNSVLLHRALVPYFLNTATAAFYHPDLHLWAPAHATTEMHAVANVTWSPDSMRPHPPFYPVVRDVSYAEPDEFSFLAGRDIFVVPVVQSIFDFSATSQAAGNVLKERISHIPEGSHTIDVHDVDDALREATDAATREHGSNGLAGILATFPDGAVWIDPTRDDLNDVIGGINARLPMPSIEGGPVFFLRAGAIIPLGIESGMATLRPPPRSAAPGARFASTLLGSIRFKPPQRGWHGRHVDALPERGGPLVLLIPSPGRAVAPFDELRLFGEHDGGLIVTRNITRRAGDTSGIFSLRVRYTAYHRPLIFVVTGVRCIRCAAPPGFDLVDSSRFEAAIDGGGVEHRVASAFIREPRGEFAVFESLSGFGGDFVLGPFA